MNNYTLVEEVKHNYANIILGIGMSCIFNLLKNMYSLKVK